MRTGCPNPPGFDIHPLLNRTQYRHRRLPWHVYCQLGLDAFLFVLWLAATAASNYACSSLCSACVTPVKDFYDGLYDVWVGSLMCGCANGAYVPGLQNLKRKLEGRGTSSSTLNAGKESESASKMAAKLGFAALMMYVNRSLDFRHTDYPVASSSQARRPLQYRESIRYAKSLPIPKVMDRRLKSRTKTMHRRKGHILRSPTISATRLLFRRYSNHAAWNCDCRYNNVKRGGEVYKVFVLASEVSPGVYNE